MTFQKSLTEWRQNGVTDVCGKPLDDTFDVTDARAALTDLSDVERQFLKDAFQKNDPDAPTTLQDVLTFDVAANVLFPPSLLRDNSGDMSIDLYNALFAVSRYKDQNFRGKRKSEPLPSPEWVYSSRRTYSTVPLFASHHILIMLFQNYIAGPPSCPSLRYYIRDSGRTVVTLMRLTTGLQG